MGNDWNYLASEFLRGCRDSGMFLILFYVVHFLAVWGLIIGAFLWFGYLSCCSA